jgi:hypothetical protein
MADVDVPMEDAVSAAPSAPLMRGGLSPDASRLFRVYKTISSMLFKRGYMVPREMRDMTPQTFSQKFGEHPSRESLTILVVSRINALNMEDIESQEALIFISLLNQLPFTRRKKPMMKQINYLCFSQKRKKLE